MTNVTLPVKNGGRTQTQVCVTSMSVLFPRGPMLATICSILYTLYPMPYALTLYPVLKAQSPCEILPFRLHVISETYPGQRCTKMETS